jgi:large repetitive protein
MAWDLDGNNSGNSNFDATQVRMDIAKEALGSMFNSFDNLGNVNIKFVDFSSSVSESAWFNDDVSSANNYLDGVNASGGTYYDTALNSVINGYNPPSADKTLMYFISDGEPNNDHSLDNSVTYGGEQGESAWTKFLVDNNVDIAYGIGISNGVSLDSLTPVAYPDTNADGDVDPYAVKVLNEFDLKKTLLDSVSDGVVQGDASVLMSSGSDGIVIGADGGSITQLVYNGVTYSATSGETASITTTHGGVLDINFTTGEYFYTINSKESISSENDVFKITATDSDGDSKTVDLVITLDFVASLDANRDYIVTNSSSPIDIDSSMLTNNDSGVNIIDSVQNPDTGSVSGTDNITIDGANSFEYTVSKTANGQTLTDSAEVDVDYQTGNTVTGTDKDEIIVGRDGEADILSAGGGDDIIVHDLSDTSIDGGSGMDTLILVDDAIDFGVLENISNIESLDLGKGGDNGKSVSLTLENITGMTDIDNDLKIFGDDNDSVNLNDPASSNTWIKSDTQSESGFDEYTSSEDSTVTLKIDDDINVDY